MTEGGLHPHFLITIVWPPLQLLPGDVIATSRDIPLSHFTNAIGASGDDGGGHSSDSFYERHTITQRDFFRSLTTACPLLANACLLLPRFYNCFTRPYWSQFHNCPVGDGKEGRFWGLTIDLQSICNWLPNRLPLCVKIDVQRKREIEVLNPLVITGGKVEL